MPIFFKTSFPVVFNGNPGLPERCFSIPREAGIATDDAPLIISFRQYDSKSAIL